jgi:hypothetical protein
MTAKPNSTKFINTEADNDDNQPYSNALDISEILSICAEYNSLGWKIQSQIHKLLDNEPIEYTFDRASLSKIKSFLTKISDNFYFGDASEQAKDTLIRLEEFEMKLKLTPIIPHIQN